MLSNESYHRCDIDLCKERDKVQEQMERAKYHRTVKYYNAQLGVLNMAIDELAKDTRPLLQELEELTEEQEEYLDTRLEMISSIRYMTGSESSRAALQMHEADGKIWAAKKVKKIVQRWQA